MRTILLFFAMLTMYSCGRFAKEERVLITSETDSVLVVSVPNAGCKNCQRIMETALKNEVGVKQSILNLHTKEVSIVYETALTAPETLEHKVSALRKKLPCK